MLFRWVWDSHKGTCYIFILTLSYYLKGNLQYVVILKKQKKVAGFPVETSTVWWILGKMKVFFLFFVQVISSLGEEYILMRGTLYRQFQYSNVVLF